MIRILDKDTVCQIAAGEVVSDYLSIIKELIENSIDAEATKIEIESFPNVIRVKDNGIGMNKEDLKLSIENHATSKLKDINFIETLGFRGEALYAINFVSKLTLWTKEEGKQIGYSYSNNKIEECVMERGTIIEVKDVFYNLPARLKFLKTQENRRILDLIESYALIKKSISFSFKNINNTYVFPSNNFYQNMEKIFQSKDFIKMSFENDKYKINGYIINEVLGYKSIISIKGRLVQDKRISMAIKNAYKHITGKERVPFLIEIECSPSLIDVNVHPSKTEVRFAENLYEIIYKMVINSFSKSEEDDFSSINWHEEQESNPINQTTCQNYFHEHKELKEKNCDNVLIEESWKFIDNFGHRYLLFSKDDRLLFLDQHAAHERIVYEKIKNETKIKLQKLLIPFVYKIEEDLFIKFFENQKILSENLEYELEERE